MIILLLWCVCCVWRETVFNNYDVDVCVDGVDVVDVACVVGVVVC